MNSAKRKRVISFYPMDMLQELEELDEISFDSSGRVRGFGDWVSRQYRKNKRGF